MLRFVCKDKGMLRLSETLWAVVTCRFSFWSYGWAEEGVREEVRREWSR